MTQSGHTSSNHAANLCTMGCRNLSLGATMRRREFITLIGSMATWPLLASAQQPARPVFGILLVFSQEAGRTFTEPLRAYMQALGYVEGRNIAFDVRYADGKADRL